MRERANDGGVCVALRLRLQVQRHREEREGSRTGGELREGVDGLVGLGVHAVAALDVLCVCFWGVACVWEEGVR